MSPRVQPRKWHDLLFGEKQRCLEGCLGLETRATIQFLIRLQDLRPKIIYLRKHLGAVGCY